MTVLQKPDNITDERWEELLEEHAERHPTDAWDTLEEVRKLLNSSRIEAMAMIKKQSRFGDQCPYYLKAKLLFTRDEAGEILTLLDKLMEELKEEDTYVRRR